MEGVGKNLWGRKPRDLWDSVSSMKRAIVDVEPSKIRRLSEQEYDQWDAAESVREEYREALRFSLRFRVLLLDRAFRRNAKQ
jgi:hypothetical protein